MKKLISLFMTVSLLLVCAVGLASCGDDEVDTLADYIAAQEATDPKQAVVGISVETAIGTLNGTVTTNYNSDGSSVIEYSYEKFNAIGEGDGEKSTVTGTVTCDKDGKYSGALTGNVDTAASIKLNLDTKLLENVSFDDGVCSATVKSENTAEVLGVELGADARLVLYKTEGSISSFTVTYRNGDNTISIVCEYN